MAVGHNKQVSGGVGKQIQNHKGVPAAEKHKILRVARSLQHPAEDTRRRLIGIADILEAPGVQRRSITG